MRAKTLRGLARRCCRRRAKFLSESSTSRIRAFVSFCPGTRLGDTRMSVGVDALAFALPIKRGSCRVTLISCRPPSAMATILRRSSPTSSSRSRPATTIATAALFGDIGGFAVALATGAAGSAGEGSPFAAASGFATFGAGVSVVWTEDVMGGLGSADCKAGAAVDNGAPSPRAGFGSDDCGDDGLAAKGLPPLPAGVAGIVSVVGQSMFALPRDPTGSIQGSGAANTGAAKPGTAETGAAETGAVLPSGLTGSGATACCCPVAGDAA